MCCSVVHSVVRNRFRSEAVIRFRWAVGYRWLTRFRTGFRNQTGFRIDCLTGYHLPTQSLHQSRRLHLIDNRYHYRCNLGGRFPICSPNRYPMCFLTG